MISEYIEAAMRRAQFQELPDGEGIYGEVPELPGVWSNQATLEACRDDLADAIESWIIVKLRHDDRDFPVLDGLDLNPQPVEQEVA